MLDKVKEIFSKEAGGNQKLILGLIAIFAVVLWIVFNTITAEKAKITNAESSGTQILNQGTNENVVVEERKKEVQKQELEKAGILYEEYNKKEVEQKEESYSFADEEEKENEEIKKLKEEMEKLKGEMERLKKEREEKERLFAFASREIGKPFEYASREKKTTQSPSPVQSPVQAVEQTAIQTGATAGGNARSAMVQVLTGTVLDEVRLPVGEKKFVRIQTDAGLLVIRATATPIGIKFAENGTLYQGNRAEQVIVQVEDTDGNVNLFSYVIDTKGEKITKTALLSFLKGFSEGMINNTVRTDTFGGTTQYIEGGLQTGVSKGVSAGLDVLIKEEKGKLKQLVDTVVLLKGEKVKVMLIRGLK